MQWLFLGRLACLFTLSQSGWDKNLLPWLLCHASLAQAVPSRQRRQAMFCFGKLRSRYQCTRSSREHFFQSWSRRCFQHVHLLTNRMQVGAGTYLINNCHAESEVFRGIYKKVSFSWQDTDDSLSVGISSFSFLIALEYISEGQLTYDWCESWTPFQSIVFFLG